MVEIQYDFSQITPLKQLLFSGATVANTGAWLLMNYGFIHCTVFVLNSYTVCNVRNQFSVKLNKFLAFSDKIK